MFKNVKIIRKLLQSFFIISLVLLNLQAADKIKALIIDGQNNHNWKIMTPSMKKTLEKATGRFDVSVSTLPSNKAKKEEWAKWKPNFANYDVVVSNYNDGGKCRWPMERRKEFIDYMTHGGGFVTVHAADNSSGDWKEYNEMIAVGGWGGRKAKTHGSILRKIDGKWQADPAPKARSGHHGPQWAFMIEIDDPSHPIVKGMPTKWKHAKDELYNCLRGPCKNVSVIASAESKVTKTHEPMAMVINFGKGKVFHTPMGHVGSLAPIHCVGFQAILARGTEYVATGEVTIPIPQGFPSESKVSIVKPEDLKWTK